MKGKKALGIIETFGFIAAIEAADTAVKAANVKLLGYELARGGLTTIKVVGDVGGVKAAISAAKTAAEKVGKVIATHVIPRPHDDVDIFIKPEKVNTVEKTAKSEEMIEPDEVKEEDNEEKKEEEVKEWDQDKATYTCNLCKDPLCPRKKGDPRVDCIHQGESS